MAYYIENRSVDPCYNLALEQYAFESLTRAHSYFMLWQNNSSVIVGKHQNTAAEINSAFINAHNISVVRRLSGGGAVYHDLGNLNYTFIADAGEDRKIDFSRFCSIIQKTLVSFGVPAEISGRNDIAVRGKKVSGNAQYAKEGRVMHHGTLLYDCDLDALCGALNITDDKLESKGIKSVRSRVANIRGYMKDDMTTDEFRAELKRKLSGELDLKEYEFKPDDISKIEEIRAQRYSQWKWNYGYSPPYNARKIRRIEGCGRIEILLNVGSRGIIEGIAFYGDFFAAGDHAELVKKIIGQRLEYNELAKVLKKTDLTQYFLNITNELFLALLFE